MNGIRFDKDNWTPQPGRIWAIRVYEDKEPETFLIEMEGARLFTEPSIDHDAVFVGPMKFTDGNKCEISGHNIAFLESTQ